MRPQPDTSHRFQRELDLPSEQVQHRSNSPAAYAFDFLGKYFRPSCSIGLPLGAA
jgi:hypothetical protein